MVGQQLTFFTRFTSEMTLCCSRPVCSEVCNQSVPTHSWAAVYE